MSEGKQKDGLIQALREIRFAVQYAQENPPTDGPLMMMHHPKSVLEFIDSVLTQHCPPQWQFGRPMEAGWYETKRHDDIEVTLWWNGKRWKASPHSPESIWLDERRRYRATAQANG